MPLKCFPDAGKISRNSELSKTIASYMQLASLPFTPPKRKLDAFVKQRRLHEKRRRRLIEFAYNC